MLERPTGHVELGRSPRGERGLKSLNQTAEKKAESRSPRGERGLKFDEGNTVAEVAASLPTRGAWIEMIPY